MSEYVTGFCGTDAHEGTRPKSPSGKPRKVCVSLGLCQCSCHKKFDEIASLAGIERVPYDNPEYVSFKSGITDFLENYARDRGADSLPSQEAKATPEKLFTDSSGVAVESLKVSGKEFKVTARGRDFGQLEDEVRRICNRYMLGEFDEQCTPKLVMKQIDPEPSQGSIAAVFDRWDKIGFAQIEHNPLKFVTITAEGLTKGLDVMKDKYKRSHRRSAKRIR